MRDPPIIRKIKTVNVFRRLLLVVVVAGLSSIFSQPAFAANPEPTGFKNVTLWVNPEYDDPRLLVYNGRRRRNSGCHRAAADDGNLSKEALDVSIDQVCNGNALYDPISIDAHLSADNIGG